MQRRELFIGSVAGCLTALVSVVIAGRAQADCHRPSLNCPILNKGHLGVGLYGPAATPGHATDHLKIERLLADDHLWFRLRTWDQHDQ